MVRRPGLTLEIRASEEFEVVGPLAERVRRFVRHVCDRCGCGEGGHPQGLDSSWPKCHVDVRPGVRQHVGLGTGTQLGLAVAAGLCAWSGRPVPSGTELAACAGRGRRSAIGVHGFSRGGLVFEAGKQQGEALSPLVRRVELPEPWRFVLICDRSREGLSGSVERKAFERLPAVPRRVSEALYEEASQRLVPAAAEGRFDDFSHSLYRFGYRAGLMFAAQQGGAFANSGLARLVEAIRAKGIAGVGQSSWGPTIFALTRNQAQAEDLISELRAEACQETLDFVVTSIDNRGARIRTFPPARRPQQQATPCEDRIENRRPG